jgi:hypothetical protein
MMACHTLYDWKWEEITPNGCPFGGIRFVSGRKRTIARQQMAGQNVTGCEVCILIASGQWA